MSAPLPLSKTIALSQCREFEMMLQDSSRMTYFLDFLMDHGAHNLLMFWLETEQFSEFTGDARACFDQATALVERYIGITPTEVELSSDEEEEHTFANKKGPRTQLCLSKSIKNRLREAVAPHADVQPHPHSGEDSDDDDDVLSSSDYFPPTNVNPDDEEEASVVGAALIGCHLPRKTESKSTTISLINCASADLFTDAQAMVAAQLLEDWYDKFQQSSSYKRLCESLFAAAPGPFKEDEGTLELLLDSSPAARRVLEDFLDNSDQRLGLLLRDQLLHASREGVSYHKTVFEAVESARATLEPFQEDSRRLVKTSSIRSGVPPHLSTAAASKKVASQESWTGVVDCLESLETLHTACTSYISVETALKKVSGLKTCQAFVSVKEDTSAFLTSQERLFLNKKKASMKMDHRNGNKSHDEQGASLRRMKGAKGFKEDENKKLSRNRSSQSIHTVFPSLLPGNLSKIGQAFSRVQEDAYKRIARTRKFQLQKVSSGKYKAEVRIHPKVRWKRAYRKVRMMLLFSSDFTDMFETRRESKRLGMMLVSDSLEEYLALQVEHEMNPTYESWIADLHPDNVKASYVSEYDNDDNSEESGEEDNSTSQHQLQKVAKRRSSGYCCVDFRFYSPESDHLKLWNSHPKVPQDAKIQIASLEDVGDSIVDSSENSSEEASPSRASNTSMDSEEEELWEWESDDEKEVSAAAATAPTENLKAFDLRTTALRLLKAYVAVLDVAKLDCSCWLKEVIWPGFLRSSYKLTLASVVAAHSSSTLRVRLMDLHRCKNARLKYGLKDCSDVWSEDEHYQEDRHNHDHHTAAILHPRSKHLLLAPQRFPELQGKYQKHNFDEPDEPPKPPKFVTAFVVDSEIVVELMDGDVQRLMKKSKKGDLAGVMNAKSHSRSTQEEDHLTLDMRVSELEAGAPAVTLEPEVMQRIQDVTLPIFCGAVHDSGGDTEKLRPTLQTFMTDDDGDCSELGACRTDWVKRKCDGHVVHLPRTRALFTVNMFNSVEVSTGGVVSGTPVKLATLDLLRSLLIVPTRVDAPCNMRAGTEVDPRSQDLRILCEALSPKTLLFALNAVILERPVVLRSRSTSTLALATTALARLANASLGLDKADLDPTEQPPKRMMVPLLPLCHFQTIRDRLFHVSPSSTSTASKPNQGSHLRSFLVGIDSRILEAAEKGNLRDGASAPLSPLASDQGSMLKGTHAHGDVRWSWAVNGAHANLEGALQGLRGLMVGAVVVDLDADSVDTSNSEAIPAFPRSVSEKIERGLHQAWHKRDIFKTSSLIFEPKHDWRECVRKGPIALESVAGQKTLLLCRQLILSQCLLPLRRFTRRFPNEAVVLLHRTHLFNSLESASPEKRACKAALEKVESMPPPPLVALSNHKSRANIEAETDAAEALSALVKSADHAVAVADMAMGTRWALLRAFMLTAGCERVLPLLTEPMDIAVVFGSKKEKRRSSL